MNLLLTAGFGSDVIPLTLVDPQDSQLHWQIGDCVELLEDNQSYYIKQAANNAFAQIEFNDPLLKSYVSRRCGGGVVCVVCYTNQTQVAVRYMVVNRYFNEPLTLTFDERALAVVAKVANVEHDFIPVKQWVEQYLMFAHRGEWGMLLFFAEQGVNQSFAILGQGYLASVIKAGKYWFIRSIKPSGQIPSNVNFYFGPHTLQYESAAKLSQAPELQLSLELHTQSHGSYFQLWQKYSQLHWQQTLRMAKSTGHLPYTKYKVLDTECRRYEFVVGENPIIQFLNNYKAELEKLGERYNLQNLELQVDEELPSVLSDGVDDGKAPQKSREKANFLSDLELTATTLKATLKARPPKQGVIFTSVHGIKKQHDRQQRAFELLSKGDNPLPQLKMIFEGLQPPELRPSSSGALSNKAARQFKSSFTEKQQRALRLALETPDITLIIGPPGTGKTQVISALQQCVAEKDGFSGNSIQHQILLTSYQHDAVNNVVSRAGVFGLPALKIGGREKGNKAGSEHILKQWRTARVTKLGDDIERLLSNSKEYQLFDTISQKLLAARLSASVLEIKAFLGEVDESLSQLRLMYGLAISPKLLDEFIACKNRFATIEGLALGKPQRQQLYRLTRGLRTTSKAWQDDGEERLGALLSGLESASQTHSFAEQLKALREQNVAALQFEPLKQQILAASVDPYTLKDKQILTDAEVACFDKLQHEVEKSLTQSPTLGQLFYRKKYVEALQHSPKWVERSIAEYVSVLGATCQQAAGDQMTSLKAVRLSNELTFNTVIVDEAARANPLDLMIPMAMARNRVVLVGDHLQLPHMLEPRVEKELQQQDELDLTELEQLKTSLFERLYRDLQRFEQQGATAKVVMLDTQFRMHPVLGAFHSRQFYESRGLPAVKAGRLAQDFPLDVPGFENKLAAWVDVGQRQGKMGSRAGSKFRRCEAVKVADIALKLLNERPDLSVGIITFYAAQRDEIQQQMVNNGVMDKSDQGVIVKDAYALLPNGDERFQIGSVDAFQGKEFDVVLLSTVRHWQTPQVLDEEEANRQLGFLRIINRINVAMSRQKRLLIVVGDKSLADKTLMQPLDNNASEALPVLPGFGAFYHQLCLGEYGCVL